MWLQSKSEHILSIYRNRFSLGICKTVYDPTCTVKTKIHCNSIGEKACSQTVHLYTFTIFKTRWTVLTGIVLTVLKCNVWTQLRCFLSWAGFFLILQAGTRPSILLLRVEVLALLTGGKGWKPRMTWWWEKENFAVGLPLHKRYEYLASKFCIKYLYAVLKMLALYTRK